MILALSYIFLVMFESNQDQQFLQDVLQNKQPDQAAANLQDTNSYGLTDNNQYNKSALNDQVLGTMANDPWSAADGATMSDGDGNVLIQGGDTTNAEQNEVNGLLSQRRFNRDWRTRNRGFRNRTTRTGSFSADERAGFDRTDSRRNAFNLGTVAYRQGKNVQGQIGYTYSGVRGRNDWFKFTAGKDGTYDFSLRGLGRNAGLALYNQSGRHF